MGRRLHPMDYQRMPWKNGGGTTTEIWKVLSPTGGMLWRLSIADVRSDGPFSLFPNVDRTIMVIEGNGMELSVEGSGPHKLDRLFEPFAFPGDAKTECRLIDGPIRDFNLMVMRGFGQGALRILDLAPKVMVPLAEDTVALHVLRGRIEAEAGALHELSAGDGWIAGGAERMTVRAMDHAMLAVITIAAHNAG